MRILYAFLRTQSHLLHILLPGARATAAGGHLLAEGRRGGRAGRISGAHFCTPSHIFAHLCTLVSHLFPNTSVCTEARIFSHLMRTYGHRMHILQEGGGRT